MNLLFADAANTASQVFLGLGTFGLILALVLGFFWLWMLVDALTNPSLDTVTKLIWGAVIFFLPFLGALAYFFIGRGAKRGSTAL